MAPVLPIRYVLWAELLSVFFFQFHKRGDSEGCMDIYEKAREVVRSAFQTGKWERAVELFQLLEGDMKLFTRSPSPIVGWDEVFYPTARLTAFVASLCPPYDLSATSKPLTSDVTFYDLAEGLMGLYAFGRFDVRYMPRARAQQRRINLVKVKRLLEELGITKGNVLTGVGQMAAKTLIYFSAKRVSYIESIYLSALAAYTLHAEMRSFDGSGRTVILETTARHQRIVNTIREWLRSAPKLYLRELPLFYDWEDAVKDMALALAEKKEDFRFTI
jgi:hypothetical protein